MAFKAYGYASMGHGAVRYTRSLAQLNKPYKNTMYDVKIPKLPTPVTYTEKHENGVVTTWHISKSLRKRLGNEGLHPLLYWVPKI